ncbi:hypothetical protein [Caballeronia sp. dw_19]|uniref:hypothetical protein n=1 Tax=Caballeronia sp. dw_19 TaxID=2719791 RepID=UPI001BD4A9BD|nr:hypothetical protein [Caballeronia sp. dw_19]
MKHDAPEHVPGSDIRRARLADLDPYIHCSVIGTCPASTDLRDIVTRFAGFDFHHRVSNFEVHHAAVQIAAEGGRGADALQEMLDHRYDGEIKRFERARNESELCHLWNTARRSGETAGAYWALMTHPHATHELRQRIVVEAHRLTYVVTGPSPMLDTD